MSFIFGTVKKGLCPKSVGLGNPFLNPQIRPELHKLEGIGPTDDPLDLASFDDRNLMNVFGRQLSQNLVSIIVRRDRGQIISGGHDLADQD